MLTQHSTPEGFHGEAAKGVRFLAIQQDYQDPAGAGHASKRC